MVNFLTGFQSQTGLSRLLFKYFLKILFFIFLQSVTGWGINDRGVSFVFGSAVVQNFLSKHDCSLIVRAHQVVEDGYQFFAQRSLLTLFSAPNYCGEFDNAGAVMGVSEDLTCWFSILPVNY